MQSLEGRVLYSASDLVRFAECKHHTVLDLTNLQTPLEKSENTEEAELFARKGDAHERAYLERLRAEGRSVVSIERDDGIAQALERTREAIRAGTEVIYQAALMQGPFFGYADFLRRVGSNGERARYEVVDTKLARTAKGKFLVQLGLYSDMLQETSGAHPERMHVVLGDGSEVGFRVADYLYYVRGLRREFLSFLEAQARDIYPLPCAYCGICQWRELCESRREADDHLSLVAGIRASQYEKLNAAGINTVAALAKADSSLAVPKLSKVTLDKLYRQAKMQVSGRAAARPLFEPIRDVSPGRGLSRLPPPSSGDVFFDFEGDPLYEGGLEYLFGVGTVEGGKLVFKPLWAHSREEERASFTSFMRWIAQQLARHPDLHIYHYGHYEPSALKRLMSLHGLCEAEMDQLLREERFVDLFKVVREALVISEPAYSLKNIEKFFMPVREGDVADAGASIVYYERWREERDDALLHKIESYNHFDVEATWQLAEWLRAMPRTHQYASARSTAEAAPKGDKTKAIEDALALLRVSLVEELPKGATAEVREFRELVYSLLDFHRRSEKPVWWAIFDRRDAELDDLIDDPECIADCERISDNDPDRKAVEAPLIYRYSPQEFKLKAGSDVMVTATAERAGTIVAIDEGRRLVGLNPRKKGPPLPDALSLGGGGPVNSVPLRDALFRFGMSVAGGEMRFSAVNDLLQRRQPRLKGRKAGQPIIASDGQLLPEALAALLALENSALFIQGPPGCGKTYTASWLITELMRRGKRVGVSSNSHKAINNLLKAVEERAGESGVTFAGIKKSSVNKPESVFDGKFISSTDGKKGIWDSDRWALIAGTAWLFADEQGEQQLDYLFIDEAGQVALANVVAMGMSARNIVLVGDQMQLGQPIQGVHPGHSGESCLEYLLQDQATVRPGSGILLEKTWRMQTDLCRFISEAVYDGRLSSHPSAVNQGLILGKGADPRLKPCGISFASVQHDGCRQRSEPEAKEIRALYANLLQQQYRDAKGSAQRLTEKDILVVAPYNMQVNLLKSQLPASARVGTVDKFQGQEAQVVLISMATSNGDCLPRHLDFLFSRNRLNVAISRARCLSVLVCCPDLLRVRCSTPEQMSLVNVLSWYVERAT